MKAVIVAAGMGARLMPVTKDTCKCLIRVGGKPMLDYHIENLRKCGIGDITMVTGYRKEQVEKHYGNAVKYVFNDRYAETNNLYSLWRGGKELRGSEVLYSHSDVLFHEGIVKKTLASAGDIVLMVEEKHCNEEDMKVFVKNGKVMRVGKDIPVKEAFGEYVGMIRFTAGGMSVFLDEAEKVIREGAINEYDAYALTRIAEKNSGINMELTGGLPWIEIDFKEDLIRAEKEILPRILSKLKMP